MSRLLTRILITAFLFGYSSVLKATGLESNSETTVSGIVISAANHQPLPNVNIVVQGKIIGTTTGIDGRFQLTVNQEPPFVLEFSSVGFKKQERVILESSKTTGLNILLEEKIILGSEVVVSASKIEENLLEVPVTIEQMDLISIRNSPSDDYYKALSNLKGIDITYNSINFPVLNSRGFNSTGNNRIVQLTDGMDSQAPALNFPIGNLVGPSELDVERVEFIPGAASALYGPNAFNGVLMVKSKNPFQYQGLSFRVKSGANHFGGNPSFGEPGSVRPSFSTDLYYAKAYKNRFAFKVNFFYSQAEDWRGTDFSDKNGRLQRTLLSNPALDEVHSYGDDRSFDLRLLAINPESSQVLVNALAAQTGIPEFQAFYYLTFIPPQAVNRTGYAEHHLMDYRSDNLKANASVHYRLTDFLEASYTLNFGHGTTAYTGAQRYRLKNFQISQHKVELKSGHFNLKGYGMFENTGDSYVADFVGLAVNEAYAPRDEWFNNYGVAFARELFNAATIAQGGNPTFNFNTVQAILSDPARVSQFHAAARSVADVSRFQPGSSEFNAAVDAALQSPVPNGALFEDNSRFFHVEGQYNFRNQIQFADIMAGANFRQTQLRSNGTIFADEDGININEWGSYLLASRNFANDLFNIAGSLRYDKHENFSGRFSPRISTVFNITDERSIRLSFQTGYRNPTLQGQYLDLNVISARLLGGLIEFAEKYNITRYSFTVNSINDYQYALLRGDPNAREKLVPFDTFNQVKPEHVKTFEVGYKGLLNSTFYFDAVYYYNIYDDFISQIGVRQINSDFNDNGIIEDDEILNPNTFTLPLLLSGNDLNTFQIYTNVDKTVRAHGAAFGLEFSVYGDYRVGINYNWNKLITGLNSFQNDFNTPQNKMNVTFGNRRITEMLGFNLAYRWQSAFHWESAFISADVGAVSTFDAQISYQIPNVNARLKVGGSNIFNNRHRLSGGGPTIGAFYYASLTFDQLFR